jgi:hypothetical protein
MDIKKSGTNIEGTNIGDGARELSKLSELHIREREKTKRLLLVLVAVLIIFAVLVMLFSPPGQENVGYILGAAIMVLALGGIGVSQFVLKMPGISVDTKEAQPSQMRAEAAHDRGTVLKSKV